MPTMPITKIGQIGLVFDVANALLEPEAWTYGENVKFSSNGISRQWGETVYATDPLPEKALYILPSDRVEQGWTIVSICENALYSSLGSTHTDVSPAGGWVITSPDPATGCFLNNLPVLNHPDNIPVFWNPGVSPICLPLPGLDPTIRFKVLRSFGNFLVGIGVKDIGATSIDTHRIMWSTTADPGTVPPTWNPIGSLAGSTILASARGDLIDCLPLGDINYIYTSNSVYSQQFIGGNFIFKFAMRFEDFGILAPDCVASFKNFHFVVTQNDFIIHNGVSWESVGTDLVRNYFKRTLDGKNIDESFIVVNEGQKEIWFFYPTQSDASKYPTNILIWNWETKTWGVRSCLPATCGASGYQKSVDDSKWNTPGIGNWSDQTLSWSLLFRESVDSVVLFGTEDGQVQACHPIMARNGIPFTTVIERSSLGFEQRDRFQRYIADPRSHKLILELWPVFRFLNDVIDIYVGGQEDYDDPIYWEGPFAFNPAVDTFIVPAISGKYVSLRFEYSGLQDFLFEGYSINFEEVGVYE